MSRKKIEASRKQINTTVGFIYWIREQYNLRGLKEISIEEFPAKLAELQKEYDRKYPQGLTGWMDDVKQI